MNEKPHRGGYKRQVRCLLSPACVRCLWLCMHVFRNNLLSGAFLSCHLVYNFSILGTQISGLIIAKLHIWETALAWPCCTDFEDRFTFLRYFFNTTGSNLIIQLLLLLGFFLWPQWQFQWARLAGVWKSWVIDLSSRNEGWLVTQHETGACYNLFPVLNLVGRLFFQWRPVS